MIDRIRLEGFQAHERLDIRLDRVTTIVGPTDSGKSSVIRALRWLCNNRPRGSAFIRDGSKTATVKLKLNDSTVERKKGKTLNSYRVDHQTFKAFGDSVPEEVERLLNLGEINFQSQHDAPFWFSLTAGEVARQLNAIVDLESIDVVMSRIASRLRKGNAEIQVLTARREEFEKELLRLDFVPRLSRQYDDLEGLSQAASKKRKFADSNALLVRKVLEYKAALKSALAVVFVAFNAAETGKEARRLSELADRCVGLVSLARRHQKTVDRGWPDLSVLDKLNKESRRLCDRSMSLSKIMKSLSLVNYGRSQCIQELVVCKNTIRKEFKGRCPICGGPFKGGK